MIISQNQLEKIILSTEHRIKKEHRLYPFEGRHTRFKNFEELTGIHLCPAAEPGLAAPPRTPHGSSSEKQEPWKEERRSGRIQTRRTAQGTATATQSLATKQRLRKKTSLRLLTQQWTSLRTAKCVPCSIVPLRPPLPCTYGAGRTKPQAAGPCVPHT